MQSFTRDEGQTSRRRRPGVCSWSWVTCLASGTWRPPPRRPGSRSTGPSAGSTPTGRSTWRSSEARSSCSISGPIAASIAITSCLIWRSSRSQVQEPACRDRRARPRSSRPRRTPRTSATRSASINIKHPVANDANQVIWDRFSVRELADHRRDRRDGAKIVEELLRRGSFCPTRQA